MPDSSATKLKFLVHGLGVDIDCDAPTLIEPISRALNDFAVQSFAGCVPVVGTIQPYDQAQVRRYLSPSATRVSTPNEMVEVYEEGERFWLIDDHWGICEINLLKGNWRAWVLPELLGDRSYVVERAILWPIAQLLRPRGLCITRGAAVMRDGWGAMILSNFSLEPELSTLARAGWRIVGQNWTALRQEHGQMMMLAMPGYLQRQPPRTPGSTQITRGERVDLRSEFPGCAAESAPCEAVLLIEPGRRPMPKITSVTPTNAMFAMRKGWGITELHPHRRQGHFPTRLAQRCKVFDVQLARDPKQILSIMELARHSPPTQRRIVA